MKKESRYFEHGKVYRFLPCKSKNERESFTKAISRGIYKYNKWHIWELGLKSNVFMYKGPGSEDIWIDGLILSRNWCEEVK